MKLNSKLFYSYVTGCIVLMIISLIILILFFDTKFKEIPIQESLVREKIQGILPIELLKKQCSILILLRLL